MPFDSGNPSISIPVGITIGLLASFVQSLGLTIQRKSHVLNQSLPESHRKVEHRRPLWLLGFAIFISSNLFGSVFQIASLPVVILAPLGAVSLLWNAFFARLLLGDVFSPWMLIGTLLIAGGAVLIAVFGIVPEPTHSLEDLLVLFSRPAFIAYFSLLGLVVLIWLVVTHAVEYSYTKRYAAVNSSPPLSPLLVPNAVPTILTTANTDAEPALATERTPLIDRKLHVRSGSKSPSSTTSVASMITSPLAFTANSPRTPIFLATSYASISGLLSGMCLLFAKSGVELLLLTVSGNNQFWRWQAWVLVLGLVVFALLQLWYMHKGLVLADPTLVCPLAFCFYNLSSIVNGLVYFDQFSLLSTTHLLLVMLGIAILLAGVWVVSTPPEGGQGIDVGTWTEPTELDENLEENAMEPYEDEPLPMHPPRSPTAARGRSEGLGLQIVTEPPAPTVAPAAQISPRSAAHGRQQTDSALVALAARRSQSSYTDSADATASTSRRRTRRTTLGPSSSFSPPLPLSPGGTSTLGGFSIGLSPMSPGFSLVPRDRRRRVTGPLGQGSIGPGGEGTEPGGQGLPGALRLRRAVSEGDAGDTSGRPALPQSTSDEWDVERNVDNGSGPPRRAKGRWKFLKSVFSRQR